MSSTAASGGPDPGGAPEPLPIRVIAGPTAVGKTAVGIAVAEHLGAEILSADSRQVYRGMTIGTSKPTPEEQARVPHHLLDVADPRDHYTAADFARDARAVIADLDRRRVPVIVVGGSGLYLRALIDGLFAGPGRQPELRAELEAWADREGSGALHAELVRVDPERARRLHPNDRVRLVRALEVERATGKPLTLWQREQAEHSFRERTRYFVLDREDPDLDARIAIRTRAMFQAGLLEEARALLAQGLSPEHATYRTIGYTEAFAVLRGEMPMAAAIIAAIQSTRQFARRQRTWFRGVKGASWKMLTPGDTPEETATELEARTEPA
jgi:tRNA dimethylallyltransferase